MAVSDIVEGLRVVMERKLAALPDRVRPWTSEYTLKNNIPRNMVLTGQRGAGKTTFLLYHARLSGERMLYFSADNPRLASESLYDVSAEAFMQGYSGVIIDEVHFARDWGRCLKSLYDDFPDRKVWASDSSALILRVGTADLSRRYVFVRMPLMSFREFLFLETGSIFLPINPFERDGAAVLPVQPDAGLLALFEEYKRHGTRPFYKEGNFEERSLALLEKTLNSDVPFFVPSITDDNIRLMTAVMGTLSAASIPRLQVRSLCSDWNVSADKLYQLLAVMDAVGAVRIVRFQNDSKAKSAGAKLFLADSCLYSVLHGNGGSQREALVAGLLADAGFSVSACRDETEGDFSVVKAAGPLAAVGPAPLKIEVGGRGKALKKSDWVIRDGTDYPTDRVIPLWLLAMMW